MPSLPVGSPPVQVSRAAPAQAPAAPAVPTAQAASAAPRSDQFDANPRPQPQAQATQPGHRPADGLRAYEELAPKQQALLGEDGAERYAALGPKERAAFIVLTTRMEQNGFDTSGLQLKAQPEGIQQDRLLFEAEPKEAVERLKGQVRDAVASGKFVEDKPSGGLHGSGMSDYGARQWVTREAMQVGFGHDGIFVDIDRFGAKTDLVGIFGHMGEILTPGKTDPFKVGKALHIDVASHLPPAGK
ncbi:MAG TPA: hypothetical protein VIG99_26565 [Myxococcaceae bacterium]|jgi:hypothetical protein